MKKNAVSIVMLALFFGFALMILQGCAATVEHRINGRLVEVSKYSHSADPEKFERARAWGAWADMAHSVTADTSIARINAVTEFAKQYPAPPLPFGQSAAKTTRTNNNTSAASTTHTRNTNNSSSSVSAHIRANPSSASEISGALEGTRKMMEEFRKKKECGD